MPRFSSRYYVTFESDNGLSIRVLLDSPSPALTGGFGGWEVVDRPRRKGLTRWKGQDPITQDIPILFDGKADGESQEGDISDLMRMARSPNNLHEPPKVRVSGLVNLPDITYVINNIQFSSQNVIWDMIGGSPARLRQPATVTILEFVDDQVITTQPTPAIVSRANVAPPKRVKAPGETTLNKLAIKYYHDPSKWMTIWLANPWLSSDPRAVIDRNSDVFIPGKDITVKA